MPARSVRCSPSFRSFKHPAESVDYLDACLETISRLPVAVELRHRRGATFDATLALLTSHGAALATD